MRPDRKVRPLARHRSRFKILRNIGLMVFSICAGTWMFGASAFADPCSDSANQYNASFRAYQSNQFQFPQDCGRAQDYFRSKREQAQSLIAAFRAAKEACGSQFDKDGRSSPENFVSLFEHQAVALQTGCDVIAGASVGAPTPQPPPPASAMAPANPPPAQAQITAPATAPPPAQVQTAPSAPVQTAVPAPAPTPTPAPPMPSNGLQSCTVQKTMPVAAGCNADFPQKLTGQACTAADNSVGLTLQVPGNEPTCCVTACGLSK